MSVLQDQVGIAALNLVLIFLLKTVALVLGYLTIKLGHDLVSSGVKANSSFRQNYKGLGQTWQVSHRDYCLSCLAHF